MKLHVFILIFLTALYSFNGAAMNKDDEAALNLIFEAPELVSSNSVQNTESWWNGWSWNAVTNFFPFGRPATNTSEALKKISDTGIEVGDKTLATITSTSKTLEEINREGLKLSSASIKALFTSGIGLALAIAGITLIYKQLSKEKPLLISDSSLTVHSKNMKEKLLDVVTNRYVIGASSILAGLLLVIKSDKLATSI
jgi:hypothetical protein